MKFPPAAAGRDGRIRSPEKGAILAKPKPIVAPPHIPSISSQKALSRLQKLSERLTTIRGEGRRSALLNTWTTDVKLVLADFYGRSSLQFEEFDAISFSPGVWYEGQPEREFEVAFSRGVDLSEGFLKSRIAELVEDLHDSGPNSALPAPLPRDEQNTHKIFVVHGHDHGTKETVARYLSKLGLDPVILHEQPDKGRTIIEKFEQHSDVACAVVILSPDDEAWLKNEPSVVEGRARQNVIFEMGFFVGRLGRNRTFALLLKGVTKPSDVDGLLYIPMHGSDDDTWKLLLLRELKAAGMGVDANKALA